MDPLSQVFFGNSFQNWLIALGVTLLVTMVLHIGKRFVFKRISVMAAQTVTDIDDMVADLIRRTKYVFILIIGIDPAGGALQPDRDGRDHHGDYPGGFLGERTDHFLDQPPGEGKC